MFFTRFSIILDAVSILPLLRAYALDEDSFNMEATLAKQSLKGKEMSNLGDVLRELYPLKAAFPNLLKVLQITLTIAVSTAECKRSFSSLRRIKTYLRSTMTNSKLADLAVLSIEKEISKNIKLEEVVDRFAASGTHRIVLN